MKKVIVLLLLYLSSFFAFQAFAQQSAPPEKSLKVAAEKRAESAKGKAAGTASENVTTPGPEGGSCSATSDDGSKTCSINCKTGQSANCSSTKTTASCKCT